MWPLRTDWPRSEGSWSGVVTAGLMRLLRLRKKKMKMTRNTTTAAATAIPAITGVFRGDLDEPADDSEDADEGINVLAAVPVVVDDDDVCDDGMDEAPVEWIDVEAAVVDADADAEDEGEDMDEDEDEVIDVEAVVVDDGTGAGEEDDGTITADADADADDEVSGTVCFQNKHNDGLL